MKRLKGEVVNREINIQSDFSLSNIELGLLENEVYNENADGKLKIIVFNKLEMILELNNKLFAN